VAAFVLDELKNAKCVRQLPLISNWPNEISRRASNSSS